MFYSTSMCGEHRFGELGLVSPQGSKEGEKEVSHVPDPEVFQQPNGQSPDLRMVSALYPLG